MLNVGARTDGSIPQRRRIVKELRRVGIGSFISSGNFKTARFAMGGKVALGRCYPYLQSQIEPLRYEWPIDGKLWLPWPLRIIITSASFW